MSSLKTHVAEQPSLLAPDAEWRKLLSEIIKGLTENMPGIQNLLELSTGNDEDAVAQFAASKELMVTLRKLEERQIAAVNQLEVHQADWKTAIDSRTGKIGRLDAQLTELKQIIIKEQDQQSVNAQKMNVETQQAEGQLSSLKEQSISAQAALKQIQNDKAALLTFQDLEQRRLENLVSEQTKQKGDLEKQKGDLEKQKERFKATVDAFNEDEQYKARVHLRREDELTRRGNELEQRVTGFDSIRTSKEKDLMERKTDLDNRSNDVEGRENAIANAEVAMQRDQTKINVESRNLQSALSILTSLANLTGSQYDGVPTLDSIQCLAASIKTRCRTLQDSCAEKDSSLTDQQEHLYKVEANLESTTKELGTLTINHEAHKKMFSSWQEKKFREGATAEELAALRKKLADKTTEHEKLLSRYATLDAYHQSYLGQVEQAKKTHEKDQAQISGLRSYSIPKLDVVEKELRCRVRDLTHENNALTASRTASDVETTKVKIKNQALEINVEQLRSQLSSAEENRKLLKNSFETLLSDKATDASVNSESHQSSLQGLTEVKAINDLLNARLRESNERLQTAATDSSALKNENNALRLQVSNNQLLLSERNNGHQKIQELEVAAGDAKIHTNTLEFECGEKEVIIARLESEIELAASNAGQRIANLEADIEQKDSRIRTLDEGLRSLEVNEGLSNINISNLNEEIVHLKDESKLAASNAGQRIAGLEADVERKDSRIRTLDEVHRSLEVEKEVSNAKLRKLYESMSLSEQDLKAKQADIDRLSASLSGEKTANEGIYEQLKTEVHNIRGITLPEKENVISKLRSEIAEQEKQAEKLHNDVTKRISSLDAKNQELKGEIEYKDARLSEIQQTEVSLRARLAHSREEVERTKTDLTNIETRKDELLATNKKLNEAVSSCRTGHSDVDLIRRQVMNLERESVQLRDLQRDLIGLRDYVQEGSDTPDTTANGNDDTIQEIRHHYDFIYNDRDKLNDECNIFFTERNRLTLDLETSKTEKADLQAENDHLNSAISDGKADLQRLNVQLRSCHCSAGSSTRKRTNDQLSSEEEEVTSSYHKRQVARRREMAPESAADPAAVVAGPSLADHPLNKSANIGQPRRPMALHPGSKWPIEDILSKDSTAHPIPQTIIAKLREHIREWDAGKQSWRKGFEGGIRRCAHSSSRKRRTNWKDDDSLLACSDCTEAGRLCVVAEEGRIELLPVCKDQDTYGLGDERYWLKPKNRTN